MGAQGMHGGEGTAMRSHAARAFPMRAHPHALQLLLPLLLLPSHPPSAQPSQPSQPRAPQPTCTEPMVAGLLTSPCAQ